MANAFYPLWKQAILIGTGASELDSGADAGVIFVDTGTYTYSTAHDFFNDLSGTHGDGGTGRANSEPITSPTYTSGTFDGADTVFASVNTGGTTVEGYVIFINDSVADTSSYLVCYFDTGITGMPFSTSAGAQVTVTWNASGIFDL